MGLLLGASIVTFCEILDLVFHNIQAKYCQRSQQSNTKTRSSTHRRHLAKQHMVDHFENRLRSSSPGQRDGLHNAHQNHFWGGLQRAGAVTHLGANQNTSPAGSSDGAPTSRRSRRPRPYGNGHVSSSKYRNGDVTSRDAMEPRVPYGNNYSNGLLWSPGWYSSGEGVA